MARSLGISGFGMWYMDAGPGFGSNFFLYITTIIDNVI